MSYELYQCCGHCENKEGCPRLQGHKSKCIQCVDLSIQTQVEIGTEADIMEEVAFRRMDDLRRDLKQDLMDKMSEIAGVAVPNASKVLMLLAHPDVIQLTNLYFGDLGDPTLCQNYEAPHSCIKESKARFENVKYGWVGSVSNIGGFGDWWCQPCKTKVMGE